MASWPELFGPLLLNLKPKRDWTPPSHPNSIPPPGVFQRRKGGRGVLLEPGERRGAHSPVPKISTKSFSLINR